MAHVNCPNCDKRLRFSDTSDPVRIRCPICKHTFRATAGSALTSQTLPASQSPAASDYSEANIGWVAKASIIVMALAGIALLAFLVYKVANTGKPDQKENPPQEIVRVVKSEEVKPTPTTMITPPVAKLPQVTSKPAVISLVTSKPAAMSPEELFAKVSPAVVRVVVRDKDFKVIGMGSGFFISADGLLVTNYHVIEKAEFATVLLSNKATLFVDGVAAVDAKADLALLKVNGKDLPYLTIAGEKPPKVGAKVYAIGNPQGLTNTLSEGMVSGLRKIKEGLSLIQTTAPISQGSSGGPLLTLNGKVVGVTTFYFRRGQNLNFAVPAGQVHRLIQKRGKLRTLASAGGKRLDKTATKELDKAWAAIRKKDWRTATRILTHLHKTQKGNPFVWFALGYLHSELKNYEIAIEHYKAAISLKPDYTSAYYSMGGAYDALKRYPEAIAAYKKAIVIKPDFAVAYFNMGIAYWHMGRNVNAISAYKQAIDIKPDFAEAYCYMGVAYNTLKRFPEAIVAYKKAIALKPDDVSAYWFMGNAYKALKRFPDAIVAYKKTIAIDPGYAAAYCSMGGAYVDLKRFPEAIAAYKKAIAIKPDDADAYILMGNAYRHLKRYTEAIVAYKKAIAIKPDDAYGHCLMGYTYDALKRYPEAVAAYKKAIVIKPDCALAYSGLAVAYESLGRHADARAASRQADLLDQKE